MSAARFDAALARAREHLRREEALAQRERVDALLAAGAEAAPAGRIAVPTATGRLLLDPEEIDWIEADDYYAAVHARGRRHLVRESLGSLEARLEGAGFVRVHRSALVRLAQVRELRSTPEGESEVVLRDGTRVPVSRRRARAVAGRVRGAGR